MASVHDRKHQLLLLILLCMMASSAFAATISAKDWLNEHNSRRAKFHASVGRSFVPLTWSCDLASLAQAYAEELVRKGCGLNHCVSDEPKCIGGENLAMNSGGPPMKASRVLTLWADDEAPSMGGHFTQVVWRATHYLGCGDASGTCGHVQVCRYLKPGNCNGKQNWPLDDSPCGPKQPNGRVDPNGNCGTATVSAPSTSPAPLASTGCSSAHVPGFKFVPFLDSGGNDIFPQPASGGIQDYGRVCLGLPQCKGFNSNGFIKDFVHPQSDWYQWTDDSCLGFYVRT